MGENGFVDFKNVSRDPALLQVRPDNDFPLIPMEIGNLEIWYFDVIDLSTDSVCIVQFYWQTDPLKKALTCHATVFTRTPVHGVLNRIQTFEMDSFQRVPHSLDITIGKNRLYMKKDDSLGNASYMVIVGIEELSAELNFHPCITGWKPWGDGIVFQDSTRCGAFSWLVPVPRAQVNGRIMIGDREYQVRDAVGYYDRVWWNSRYRPARAKHRLFIDDTITRWEWCRFLSPEYSLIFTALHLRPWLNQPAIRSAMLAKDNRIIHSSSNRARIRTTRPHTADEKGETFPESILVELPYGTGTATLRLTLKEIIERRELLSDLGPFLRTLIGRIFGHPQSYYLLMEGTLTVVEAETAPVELKGTAFYEAMIISEKPTGWEDTVRRLVHRVTA